MSDETAESEPKLTTKHDAAILALLTHSTVEEAAKACETSSATLHRWLKQEAFTRALQDARLAILDTATMQLRNAASEAVETLKRNLNCGKASDEIRAASIILDMAYKSAELEEMADRIAQLEAFLKPEERRAA